MTATAKTHAIERTSPKGEPFVGTCVLCGQAGLSFSAVHEPCENVRGLTHDEVLIEAMEPPKVTGEH